MKTTLTRTFLAIFALSAMHVNASEPEPPSTVAFEGKTYFVEHSIVEDQGKRKVLLYYPNLPDYNDEYYETYPDRTRDGGAVTDIRFGDWSLETGQVAILGSLNVCLNQLDGETYPMDGEGKLSYFRRERKEPGFVLANWSYAEEKGFGFYEDGTHFVGRDYTVHVKQNNGAFTFHKIPHLTEEMLLQAERDKQMNLSFDISQVEAPGSVEDDVYLAELREAVGRQDEWKFPEDLMKLSEGNFCINLGGSDISVSDTYIVYHFATDGAVSLKGLFYFPYPGKEEMLKLYLNATGDEAGEKEWRAEEGSGPTALLRRDQEACDLGEGKFALYGRLNRWNSEGNPVPLLFFYQINQEGKPILEKVVKASEQQAEKGDNKGLTKEIILTEPAGPVVPFK